jgi:Rieske Fe-S protein
MTLGPSPDNAGSPDRRHFLAGGAVATGAMAGGLVLGYGQFLRCAGQYLYPSGDETAWMFVTDVASLAPGAAMAFESPTGVSVVVTRKAAPAVGQSPTAADFLALSSICPHLGCRVHWEANNDRFFCPCHNGAFDPEGKAIAGPPLADGQNLPEYPLTIEGTLLYIKLPIKPIDQMSYRVVQADGKDNCGLRIADCGIETIRNPQSAIRNPADRGGLA